MTRIKCSQCQYFKDNSTWKQCTRYNIGMNKDSICVDCEEIDNKNE